jgi:phosphatidylserine/phosphatidylglycerophosphate/cardiolipin synthase-like enzyme
MSSVEDWLLASDERGNPDSRLEIGDGRPDWTDHNEVTQLVHGAEYFARLDQELRGVGVGDRVWFLDWRGDGDERLAGPGSELGTALTDAVRRGAEVRGLVWRSHPDQEKFSEQENVHLAEVVNAAGGEVLLDERVRRFGSHHQKLVLVLRDVGGPDLAFVGGIDLCHGRHDDADHHGDPQAIQLDRRYGPTPAWHDVQLEVRGPAVAELEATFRERWADPAPLDHRDPLRRAIRRAARERPTPSPLPERRPEMPESGPVAVQVLRTYPAKRPPFPFARRGERSVARAYLKAFARARSLIYVEDQYLWSREVAGVLADALARSPELRVIAVVPRHPDRDGTLSGPLQRVGQLEALSTVLEAAGDRAAVYDLENEAGWPIYVHAKCCIVDDVWMSVGSDNLNRRSWTHDSELACAVLDPRPDDRQPLDPAGLGDGARVLPRSLRLRLWREHLGSGPSDEELLEPKLGFEAWRRAADALDRWHAGGGRGQRPGGRVRVHRPEPVKRWQTWWAVPLHRIAIDPDGRPRDLKRKRTF